jgi:hypothetical protein
VISSQLPYTPRSFCDRQTCGVGHPQLVAWLLRSFACLPTFQVLHVICIADEDCTGIN